MKYTYILGTSDNAASVYMVKKRMIYHKFMIEALNANYKKK